MTKIKKIHVSHGFMSEVALLNTLLDTYATDDESADKSETIACSAKYVLYVPSKE